MWISLVIVDTLTPAVRHFGHMYVCDSSGLADLPPAPYTRQLVDVNSPVVRGMPGGLP